MSFYHGGALEGQVVVSERMISVTPKDDDATVIVTTPRKCGGCGVSRAIWVNRFGRTYCAVCDARRGGL